MWRRPVTGRGRSERVTHQPELGRFGLDLPGNALNPEVEPAPSEVFRLESGVIGNRTQSTAQDAGDAPRKGNLAGACG